MKRLYFFLIVTCYPIYIGTIIASFHHVRITAEPFKTIIAILAIYAILSFFALWILMLVNLINRNFKSKASKTRWFLFVLFFHLVSTPIYYFKFVFKDHE